MSPDEILSKLRDIHLPPVPDSTDGVEFTLAPLVVLALLAFAALTLAWWRRSLWRRQAKAVLNDLDAEASAERCFAGLARLAVAVARNTGTASPPPEVYLPPERVGPEQSRAVRRWLGQSLGR